MRRAQVTIVDIARELGISPSTVSRGLKDHPEISEGTRRKVKELARKYGYKPNAIALSLRHNRTNIIGLVIPQTVHYFFSQVISGIEDIANDGGFQVMICQSDESYTREVKSVQTLIDSRIDGLLVSLSKETKDFSHFKRVQAQGLPIVFFDRICEKIDTDRVVVDDFEGAYKAVEHLISIGCARIAHLGTSRELAIGRERYNGYLKALEDHGLKADERLIVNCDNLEAAKQVTKRLVYELNPPDGIFAVNDLTAIGALQTIKANGFKVPGDIAIAGFSNGIYSTMTDPPLTTVEQHGYKVGRVAADLLINRILSKKDFQVITEVIETQLLVRGSTVKKRVYSG